MKPSSTLLFFSFFTLALSPVSRATVVIPSTRQIQASQDLAKEVEFYNHILAKLKLPRVNPLTVKLRFEEGPTSGQQQGDEVKLFIPNLNYDQAALFHEGGHAVHYAVAPWQFATTTKERQANQGLFIEGTANLLSALYSGDSVIGHDRFEMKIDLNSPRVLHFPDHLYNLHEYYADLFQAKNFCQAYPDTAKRALAHYQMRKNKASMNGPAIYVSSAVWTQALWKASLFFGREEVAGVFLEALPHIVDSDDLPKAVTAILASANKTDAALETFLAREFSLRGFN